MTQHTELAVQALQWSGDTLRVLDQRQLPQHIVYDDCHTVQDVFDAIVTMRVRGAPAIGIAAAYGVALSVRQHYIENPNHWRQGVATDLAKLAQSRPTAVNLFWALAKMQSLLDQPLADPVNEFAACAQHIHAEDIAANRLMGEVGADLLHGAQGVLTHCNTGALATGGYGTALGVIRSAYRRAPLKVFASETRPWLQGARLTVWELAQDAIPATLIADSAAAWLMQSGAIDWVIVGADRIAANGDTANKIGTYSLAVLAKQMNVKFMVVAPTSTIDGSIQHGKQIAIEERNPNELLPTPYLEPGSLVSAWNPVFDVTPAELIRC